MNVLFQKDQSYFIYNNVVLTFEELKKQFQHYPLGNWIKSARAITLLENNLYCELKTLMDTWEKAELSFDYNHFYDNENGKFKKTKFNNTNILPNGNWIKCLINFKLLEPANEKGLGKFKCDLRNKYSSYTYNELEFNINDSYDNVNGEFWKFNYEIMSILKLLDPIPKKIFQTHKNLDYVLLKYKTRTGYQSWFKYNGDFEYNFYSDENSQKFIQNNFDSKVLEAYEKCPLNVMKADLWRYCVIYYYGGIYADMDAVLMTDPTVFLQPNSLLVFSPETDNIHLCQWTFAAPPKSPVLKSIIDLSVERILSCQEIKGDHIIHFLTGPKVFTDGIEKFLKRMDCKIYPGKFKYENYQNNILHCFNPHYFHNKVIRHLFAGSDDDGWKPERDRVLV